MCILTFFKGFGTGAGLSGIIGWGTSIDTSVCAGFGDMVCLGKELKNTEGEATVGGSVNYGRSYLLDSKNDEYSHLVSFTWSYLTSGEQTEPGQSRDAKKR